MSRRQVQLNLVWDDPSIVDGIEYVDGYEKRNFKLNTEAELNDLYDQIKQVIVNYFTP